MKTAVALLVLALTSLACTTGQPPVTPSSTTTTSTTTSSSTPTTPTPVVIVTATGQLASGYDLQVNTSLGRTDWLTNGADSLQAAYPAGQAWGFIGAVVAGSTTPGSRPGKDLSTYKTLQMQLRGAAGAEAVDVGIKDNTNPDDGTEIRKTVTLTSTWTTYSFTLSDFTTAARTRLYLVFELVFNGSPGRTVYLRDVQYLP